MDVSRRFLMLALGSGAAGLGGLTASTGSVAQVSTATRQRVIVIGAGIAGLAAARKLVAAGHSVVVLEGRNRIGGRVWTENIEGVPMDIGAGWIHGPNGGNPITPLAAQAGARTYETNDSSVRVMDASGTDVTTRQFDEGSAKNRRLLAAVATAMAAGGPDKSLAQALTEADPTALTDPFNLYPLNTTTEFDSGGWLEAFSARSYNNDEKFPGKDVLFPGGYKVIPELLAQGLDVRLNTTVTNISHTANGVTVTANNGSFTGDWCVNTLPLGVLKAGTVTVSPALAADKQASIGRLGFGQINKLFMVFDNAFWPTDLQYFGWHSPLRGRYSYFLSYRTFSNINCLVTFGFGQQGQALEQLNDAQLIADVTPALRTVFGANAVAPRRVLLTRWNGDAFARGAYSFQAVGCTAEDHVTLAQPAGRLLFAGEHTHEKYRATVHGAFITGEREADRVVAANGRSAAMEPFDRVMNWAESAVDLLRPRGMQTQTVGQYRYRAYPNGFVVGLDTVSGSLVYLAPGATALATLGPVASFVPQATAAGF